MAEAISNNLELLTCPICLDLLKEPVTLHCGHSYCMRCIKGCWNQEDHKGVYSCPQCRHTFSPRPLLKKNNIVAELVEQIKRIRIQRPSSSLANNFAGPGDVECDVCTGRKLKAVKSCLECLVSYCDSHYKVHNDVNPGRQHSVVDATVQLQERICPDHKKVFEIFCRTDQSCICYLCMMHGHKGHDTVTAAEERADREKQWRQTQRKYKQGIQERDKELQELRKAVEVVKSSAQTAVQDSERIFTEMIRSIERRRSEVTELIRAQEKAELSRVEGVLKRLEQEIAEMKKRDAELEQLSHTEDHIHFLRTHQSAGNIPPQSEDLSSVIFNQGLSFEAVKNSVSALKELLENMCKDKVLKISAAVTEVHLTEPVTRRDFLQYLHWLLWYPDASCPKMINKPQRVEEDSYQFKLDLNTAHRNLHLSDESRSVEWRVQPQSYPEHMARFDPWWQVLCKSCVYARRSYWEVELLRKWGGCIAVSYKCISRKGRDNMCKFGRNNQSWRLDVFSCSASFWHDNKKTELPLVRSSRIGVYVDHRAGILAFYSVSDNGTMTLLHRVQTTFTLPLYPGFCLFNGSSMKLL